MGDREEILDIGINEHIVNPIKVSRMFEASYTNLKAVLRRKF